MHRPNQIDPFERKVNWRKRLVIVAAIIGVLSAAVLLIREAANVADEFGPAPGSLLVNINTATLEQLETIPGVGRHERHRLWQEGRTRLSKTW